MGKEAEEQQQVNASQSLRAATDHFSAGRIGAAQELCQAVLAAFPRSAEALNLLGRIAMQSGDKHKARELVLAAVALNNTVPEYYNNLIYILLSSNLLEEAEQGLRDAMRYAPSAEASNNLGTILQGRGHIPEAIEFYRDAVKLSPRNAVMFNNLGAALQVDGQFEEAEEAFLQACALDSLNMGAMLNLGNLYCGAGRYGEGIDYYRQLIALDSRQVLAHYNLANALKDLGQLEEAIASYKQALQIHPRFDQAFSAMLVTMQYAEGYSADAICLEHQAFAKRFETGDWPRHDNEVLVGKRLRIGYVSPDFRAHAVAYFLEPVLARHDKQQFEVFCYYNHGVLDAVTTRLQAHADHWRNVSALNDADLAKQIADDRIDILVDLAGHTGGGRMLTFAQKPAPVQVSWLGYFSTTGLRAMDYRICDVHTDPVGLTEATYIEKLQRLPETFMCYLPPLGDLVVAPPPCLKEGYVTFGSFNNLSKVTPAVIVLWARVLQSVEGSKLLLKYKALADAETRKKVVADFEKLGVPSSKLILASHSASHTDHMHRYGEVDICLDPFPFNGATTSFDAMWMGVPVVTLAGDRFLSRMGTSMAINLGLEQLVAQSADQYVEIAVALAGNTQELAHLRSGMRARMEKSALVDANRFTLHLEQAYREMWTDWCERVDCGSSPQ